MRVHGRVIGAERRAAAMWRLQRHGLARLERDWERLPVPVGGAPATRPAADRRSPLGRPAFDHPDGGSGVALARDLDLFGHASLYRLLDPGMTPAGGAALAGWLLEPAAPAEIAARQEAVAELAPALDHRQRLALAAVGAERLAAETAEGRVGERSGDGPAPGESAPSTTPRAAARGRAAEPASDPERFFAWAEGEPWLLRRPALILASWVMPPVALAGLLTPVVSRSSPVSSR
jgi:hypothetical protein